MSWLWLVAIVAPLIAGALAMRWPRSAAWAWTSVLPALLCVAVNPEPLVISILWPGTQWGLEDPLGRAWLGFTALLWGCATGFAYHDPTLRDHLRRFWSLWSIALAGNLLLIVSLDAAGFYVGFSMMSLAAYALVAHLAGPGPRQAGRLYLQLAMLGEMLVFSGMLLRIDAAGGSLLLGDLQQAPVSELAALLLVAGFGIKAGFWPLHVWLPMAHPAAPPAASAVLSGAMLKAGVLGIWRFLPIGEATFAGQASLILLGLGLVTAFYGVVFGLLQRRAKSVLAYSSVSQIGYLLIIIALAWSDPDHRGAAASLLALYAVHHGLAKGALFMGAGLAHQQKLKPLHLALLGIAALALAGAPLTSGGAVKTQLKSLMTEGAWADWTLLLSLGSVGTALLAGRAVWLMLREQPAGGHIAPAQIAFWAPLCMASLVLPWAWPPLRGALVYSLDWSYTWSMLWPILVAGLALAAASQLGWGSGLAGRLPQPARYLSLGLVRALQRPPRLPAGRIRPDFRPLERQLNRRLSGEPVMWSAWVLLSLLLVGWLFGQ
ncbi:Formate hydrogenlyase subunit 3/Multisubunit Na+/H+ antiporter, MnhD subunit [Halopseudomonas xinjiangensis]|uniref:Formate hydrogenlyase subunit 3/Multisubunit Na+/H+ antiporter, MnhD subunit n=1 Tax=Halopseudomonas xinjiangensis TaxID=487184 RepID=A0A1H1YX64_9GAMM|nr:complex I subunit 5 family protein [Halopseudomonas xinjiangensis]SDT25546.1 Formate hydrogenlyase subunit 3/Multisubunit Na+/H+ antiporter, MnhD subunit [Halopseudomonas xinjiangensis]